MISSLLASLQPSVLAILRLTSGFMFVQHGLQKLGYLDGRLREFPEITWFAMVFEVLGSTLLMLGLFTRPVAFLLCGQMAVAYFTLVPQGFWPILNGGERAYLFCFIFLFLTMAGAGRLSLGGWIGSRTGERWWL